jgi:hypothetical protein
MASSLLVLIVRLFPGADAVIERATALLHGLRPNEDNGHCIGFKSGTRRTGRTKRWLRSSFNAAFSRFGVMFFSDPAASFINIRRSLRPNGRLAFVCWRALEENALDILPLRPRPLICRHSPLTTRTRPAHSHSPAPTVCAAFWKVRASASRYHCP